MSCSDAVFRTLQSQVFGQEEPQDSLSGTAPHMSTQRHASDSFSQAFPLRFLHAASDQKLEAGTTYQV